VEVSTDGGSTWSDADLGEARSAFAWRPWTFAWTPPSEGDYELWSRATDGAGNVQPTEQRWNVEGVQNTMAQRVRVRVGPPDAT
jgi:hypothetical protein